MKQLCTSLSEKLEVLKILDDEMANLWCEVNEDGAEGELVKEVEEADDIRTEWSKVLMDAGDFIRNAEQQSSRVHASPSPSPESFRTVRAKLPKLEVKKFSGQVYEWQEFWDSFECSIHSNDELSTVDTFSYLKGLLSDQAKTTNAGFAMTAANYQAAVDLLKSRYRERTSMS